MNPVARSIRLLLSLLCVGVVIWSLFELIHRKLIEHAAQADRPITLTVLHFGGTEEDHINDTLCKQFEAEHPTIRVLRINAGGEFGSKLKTMLAAGTPPDVFYFPPEILPDMATQHLLAPLDDYVNHDDPAWKNDIFPILLDACRYDVATQKVGVGPLFGLPKDCATACFYVNTDLFDRAGVSVPYKGWTWDEFEADMKKITALNDSPGYTGSHLYGSLLTIGADSLLNVIWTYGGDYFGKDFRDVQLDQPPAQEAMEMIRRCRIVDRTAYNPTGIAKDGGQEFFNGNIGCIGPIGNWMMPRYKEIKKFKWDIVPIPHKTQQVSQIWHVGWTMSAAGKHKDESYALMRFLCGREGQIMQSQLGLSIPAMKSVAYSDAYFKPPGFPDIHIGTFLDALPTARIAQMPKEAEFPQIVNERMGKALQLGQSTSMEAAKDIQTAWINELNAPLRQQAWPAMNWRLILSIAAGVIAIGASGLFFVTRREKLGPIDRATERAGWLFISPWVVGFVALTLGPMVLSLILSFTRWNAMSPMADAESVGTANYRQLLGTDTTFFQSLKVTGYFVILAVPVGQIAALAVALLMNSKVRGIAIFRTIYFVPSVVSGVALAVLWLQIFNNDYGLLNAALRPIAKLVGTTPPDWFGRDAHVWAIPAFVIMGLWGVGGGMIIYLAGLKGISATLYEAAAIDGAGPLRKFWNVTLPQLSPLIFYNLVMGIIGSFQVFTQAYVMTGPGPDNATLFYVLNLYRQAFDYHNMGYASAMAWVLFVIVLLATALLFRSSKNLVHYEGLK